MATFLSVAENAGLDFNARRMLSRWKNLEERGRKLQAEPTALSAFQPETETPSEVGMRELISDEFTPEELVAMWDGPHYIDWDAHQRVAYA